MPKRFLPFGDDNRSCSPGIHAVSGPARRQVLQGGMSLLAASVLAGCSALPGWPASAGLGGPRLGFKPLPPSSADRLGVPEGYEARVVAAWGDPVGIAERMPAFRFDAGNGADEQALQLGMHHDGMQYLALAGPARGLLVINHEYTDDGLLHPDGQRNWTLQKVRKAQAANGISVVEAALADGRWQPVRPSRFARRISALTPLAMSGPAAGHRLLRTAADPGGRSVLGTFANCALGLTPWGTCLSGEENWADYFSAADVPTADERRYGIAKATWYRWPEHDERFDTVRHPNEPHRFGWIVEVDPFDPDGTPVKRTALGRGAKEGAWVAVAGDGRAVVYSGEDAAFEYVYKFVSRDPIAAAGPGRTAAQANATLLDHGTLYVARFDADGSGRWLPLVQGRGPLTAANGFDDAGAVLVRLRQAADLLGATPMDRPEWIAIDPVSRWVHCALTHNRDRGAPGQPAPDAANPRAGNTMGQIIRWREEGDFSGDRFTWNHLLLAGDPAAARAEARGTVRGDAFGCPDTLVIDGRGVLWIGTDVGAAALNRGEMAPLGNNQLLACDPASGEVRRFMTAPVGAELSGVCFAPDGRTLFVNVQHPGEPPEGRSDPDAPRRWSNWPDFSPIGRPRSATVAVRRIDGGIIGG